MGQLGYVKCYVCGYVARLVCPACQGPVCHEHQYRHPDCEEGR